MENKLTTENVKKFFSTIESMESEAFMQKVEAIVSDDVVECICDHIEDFYGVEDDEQVGMLAQLVVTGVLLGKEENLQ